MIKRLRKHQKMNCVELYFLPPLIACRIEQLCKRKNSCKKLCLKTLGKGTMGICFLSCNGELILGAGDRDDQGRG